MSDLYLKLYFVSWTWLKTLSHCAHIVFVVILTEYWDSMSYINLTVYRLVFSMSVLFTIIMSFQTNYNLPPFLSLFSPDKSACILTADPFKEFHLQLALKEEEAKVREE